jgi:Transposase DDE domain/Transposase domain (DUF772)
MQITPRERLQRYAHWLQDTLFGLVEEHTGGPLSEKAKLLAAVLDILPLTRQLPCARGWRGRPSKDRLALASAFVAKAVHGLQTTRQLLDRLRVDRQLRLLCGWSSVRQVPHESTFSRAFQEFAETELPQRLHEALVLETQKGRLVGHISRDSTAVEAREYFAPKRKPKKVKTSKKRGRPRPGQSAAPSDNRLLRQLTQTLPEMLRELPTGCDIGSKLSSKGHQQYWRGYKLHIDVADGGLPINCLLTSASLHDSQAAIPLATVTAQRVTSLYDIMDAAYDAKAIAQHSRGLGHVPVIAPNGAPVPVPKRVQESQRGYDKRRKPVTQSNRKRPPLTPAEQQRYQLRSMSESVNSRLKDEFGARSVRVRGAVKVMAHLMFGVLALTVDQWLKLSG